MVPYYPRSMPDFTRLSTWDLNLLRDLFSAISAGPLFRNLSGGQEAPIPKVYPASFDDLVSSQCLRRSQLSMRVGTTFEAILSTSRARYADYLLVSSVFWHLRHMLRESLLSTELITEENFDHCVLANTCRRAQSICQG